MSNGTASQNPPVAPQGPKIKGAIVWVTPDTSESGVIPFQYNPEKLTRNLSLRFAGGTSENPAMPARIAGAPSESITLEAQLDATAALDSGDATAKKRGIWPQLATLELLAYPDLDTIDQNKKLLSKGTIEAIPSPTARTLLAWGLSRILPVRITSLNVSEQLFDSSLNPIRATVTLSLQVVTYSDVLPDDKFFNAYRAHQLTLRRVAKSYTPSQPKTLGAVKSRLK